MNNKFIQGLFLIDLVEYTDEYMVQMNTLKTSYLIDWSFVKEIDGRSLYSAVMRDESKITDSVDSEGNPIYGLLTVIGARNPEVIGIWDMEGNILTNYPFNKTSYVPYMDDINTYDEEGNLLTSVRPTIPKPIMIFGGFNSPNMN